MNAALLMLLLRTNARNDQIRTLPRAMMRKPLHRSPSENSNSSALKSLRAVRELSNCSSVGERLDRKGVFQERPRDWCVQRSGERILTACDFGHCPPCLPRSHIGT